jgi:hypothetical protein
VIVFTCQLLLVAGISPMPTVRRRERRCDRLYPAIIARVADRQRIAWAMAGEAPFARQ